MRMMSRKHPVSVAIIALVLVFGVASCSDKKEQEQQSGSQNNVSGQAAQNIQPHTAPVQQQTADNNSAAAQPSGNVFVPAPLSPIAQNDPGRRRLTYEVTTDYKCKNNTGFKAVFKRSPNAVAITFPGRVTVTLPRQDVQGAGFWYADAQYSLRGSGPIAQWSMKGRDPVDCEVRVYEAP